MSAATDSPAIPLTASPAGSAAAEALTRAASAAAAVLPSPSPLVLGPADGSTPDGQGSAVVASFAGAVSGSVAIIVDPSLEAALAAAENGALPVVEALQPALEAASAAIGPAVLATAQLMPAATLVDGDEFSWAPLTGDGEVLVWVGLKVPGGRPADPGAPGGPAMAAGIVRRTEVGSLSLLRDVEMTLTVELGRTSMPVRDLLSLAPGSVIELDRAAGAPADLMVNGRLIARGEIVVVDEDYGLRITEIIDPDGEG